MKRLAVIAISSKEGCVETYVEYLLDSLKKDIENLIIVFNGEIQEEDLKKLETYTDMVYLRENMGYDGGAFKDVFTRYINGDYLLSFDEMLLINDSCYGPFKPWKYYFDRMKEMDADFWGLTKNYASTLPTHLQSYFIVVRKKMFQDFRFNLFWERLQYPRSHDELVLNFEVGFSLYFINCGFRCEAWVERFEKYKELDKEDDLTLADADILLKEFEFPVLKRKVFKYFLKKEASESLKYLQGETNYPVAYLLDDVEKTRKDTIPYDLRNLETFYQTHTRIFIYGNGKYAERLSLYFNQKNWKFEGFIVTLKKENEDVFEFEKLELNETDGVILGVVNRKAYAEIYAKTLARIPARNLFLPQL